MRKKREIFIRQTWTDAQEAKLKKLYPKTDNEVIAEKMAMSVLSIRAKAQKMRLKKSDRYWDKQDEIWLVKNYPLLSIPELQEHLTPKTKWAIINKYRSLRGLRVDNGK